MTIQPLQLVHERWHRWNCLTVTSTWLKLHIAPELGGRIVNYQLGEHAFLWTNPRLSRSDQAGSDAGTDAGWPNWGGDKVWLAPQGWETQDQWAGPPDPVLDAGAFQAEQIDAGQDEIRLRLTSPPDMRSGMQISRVLSVTGSSTRLSILCTMTNVSDRMRRWGIWPVTQIDAASRRGDGWNTKLRAYVPLNHASLHPSGYRVIYGSAANTQYYVARNVLEVRYKHTVGKIGADSDAGWIATVDGETGNVLVQQMTFEPCAEYPDAASVEVWTNGLGVLHAYGRTVEMPNDLESNPYMLECELVSPFARLQPGESFDYAYSWASANIGADGTQSRRILSCSEVGCEVEPFFISRDGELGGRFGIFHPGDCSIEFINEQGLVGLPIHVAKATPLSPLIVAGACEIPVDATWAVLAIYDSKDSTRPASEGARIGELARVLL